MHDEGRSRKGERERRGESGYNSDERAMSREALSSERTKTLCTSAMLRWAVCMGQWEMSVLAEWYVRTRNTAKLPVRV